LRAAIGGAVENLREYSLDYRLLLPGNVIRWMTSRGQAIRPAEGKGPRLLGVAIDVTAQKHAEEERTRQQEELAHISRVNVLGEIAASLAHELRQPLTGIMANAGACLRRHQQGKLDDAKLREILDDIIADSQRADDVITSLRKMLRKEATTRLPLDINEALERVVLLIKSDVAKRGCTLETALQKELPPVLGSSVQVQQVVMNLVVNALDANALQDSEGKRRRVILKSVRGKEDNSVQISVTDEGPGLPPDPKRVFDHFYTTKKEGLGLGLAIARTIVEEHGGTLTAHNVADGGACFQFTLPVAVSLAPQPVVT
jgi:signal transduction histidine kinase